MTELAKLLRNVLQFFVLVVCDLLSFYAALFIAFFLRAELLSIAVPDLPVFSFSYFHFISLWWIPSVFIFFIFYDHLYDNNLTFWDETRIMVKAISLASITLMAIVTLGKMGGIVSRFVLLGMWVSSLFVFPVFRFWGKRVLYAAGIRREKVLIIGAGNAGRLVIDGLQREKHMGYDVIGFLDDDKQKVGKTIYGKEVFGGVEEFSRFIKELGAKTAVL